MQPGQQLAHYRIDEMLGRGGMGEVWRARDTRLERDVALKFLPPEFAADAERLARFRNEARLLASLNHVNIAAIHGLEESDDVSPQRCPVHPSRWSTGGNGRWCAGSRRPATDPNGP